MPGEHQQYCGTHPCRSQQAVQQYSLCIWQTRHPAMATQHCTTHACAEDAMHDWQWSPQPERSCESYVDITKHTRQEGL